MRLEIPLLDALVFRELGGIRALAEIVIHLLSGAFPTAPLEVSEGAHTLERWEESRETSDCTMSVDLVH